MIRHLFLSFCEIASKNLIWYNFFGWTYKGFRPLFTLYHTVSEKCPETLVFGIGVSLKRFRLRRCCGRYGTG